MGNTCCELETSKEKELGLTRPILEVSPQDPASSSNVLTMTSPGKDTKTKSDSTADQQTIAFAGKAPIMFMKGFRDDQGDLLRHLAGSSAEQTPASNIHDPLNLLSGPIGGSKDIQQSSQTADKKSGQQGSSENAKNRPQTTEWGFTQASAVATKGKAGGTSNKTAKVRVMLKNLRN